MAQEEETQEELYAGMWERLEESTPGLIEETRRRTETVDRLFAELTQAPPGRRLGLVQQERFRSLADGPRRDAAWRQLCLAMASDWPFMVVRDQAGQYAAERVRTHLDGFAAACRGDDLDALAERDDPWGTRAPAAAPVG